MQANRYFLNKLKKCLALFSGIVFFGAAIFGGLVSCSDEHHHVYNQRIAEHQYLCTPATCTEPATYYFSCKCGEKGEKTFKYGQKLGHSFTQRVETDEYLAVEGSCSKYPSYYYSCECGECGNDTFIGSSYTPHKFDKKVATSQYLATEATCTKPATYYYSCECGLKGEKTFESGYPLPHTYDQQVISNEYLFTAATCTSPAIYHYSCECGEKSSELFYYGEALEHKYDKQVPTDDFLVTPASCTEKAVYYYSCECGGHNEETFEYGEKLPHTFEKIIPEDKYLKTPASCTSPAVYYYACECGEKGESTYFFGDPLPHTFDQQVQEDKYLFRDATCSHPKEYFYSCECGKCGEETFEVGSIDENNHLLIADYISVYPTNQDEGVLHCHCSECHEDFELSFDIDYDEYTLLDYIINNGSCYIDTGIYSTTSNYELCYEGATTSRSATYSYFNDGGDTQLFCDSTSNVYWWQKGNSRLSIQPDTNDGNKLVVQASQTNTERSMDVNGGKRKSSETLPLSGKTLLLSSFDNPGSLSGISAYIYSASISLDGKTQRYFIPVRNSKGEVGLLDIINNKFYKNASGKGTFEAGHAIDKQLNNYSEMVVSNEYLKTPASCSSPAIYYYSSPNGFMGLETFEYGDTLPHQYEYYVESYPTLTEDGLAHGICSDCGKEHNLILPKLDSSKYEILDYIEANGGQYIDLDLSIKNGDSKCQMTLDYQFLSDNLNSKLGSAYLMSVDYEFVNTINRSKIVVGYDPVSNGLIYLYVDDIPVKNYTYGDYFATYSKAKNIGVNLFREGSTDNSFTNEIGSHARLFSCYIQIDGVLERALIPVKDKVSGKVGLYDAINGVFYGNANPKEKNDFTAGYLHDFSDFELLDYLQFDGEHVLNTNLACNAKWTQVITYDTPEIQKQTNGYKGGFDAYWGINESGNYTLGSNITLNSKIDVQDIVEFTLQNNYVSIKINNKEQKSFEISKSSYDQSNVYTLGSYCGDAYPSVFKLYSLTCDIGEDITKYFLPVQNKITQEKGLYCITENIFYPLTSAQSDFSDNFFKDNAEFNLDFAKDAIKILYAYADDEITSLELKDTMCLEGFVELDRLYYSETPEAKTQDSAQYVLLRKQVYRDGDYYNLYVLAVCDSGDDSEWISNANIGTQSNTFHQGFNKAADYIINRIKQHIDTDKTHNKLMITGHSRGGSVGGVINAKLIENYKLFTENDIYAYLFGCSKYSDRNVMYKGVFSINNKGDMLTQIPLTNWGYRIEGTEYYLPTDSTTIDKLDKRIIDQKILEYTDLTEEDIKELKGFQGLTNCDSIVATIQKMAPNASVLRDEKNAEYFGQIASILASGKHSLFDFAGVVLGISTNCLFKGIPLDYGAAIEFATYASNNVDETYYSHNLQTYYCWMMVIDTL